LIFALLFFAAIVIGWVASMVGVGGGIFMVPLLVFLNSVGTTQEAVGTSLAAIVFNSISSTIAYSRQKKIDYKFALALLPMALVGAWLGAFLTEFVSSDALAIAFGVLLLYVSGLMLAGKEPKELGLLLRRGLDAHGNPSPLLGAVVGLIAGVAAGFFGIGGGIVMVPAMNIFLGVDIVSAVATSLFVMGPSSLIAAITHFFQGNLHIDLAIPLALGIIIGAQLGAWSTTKVSKIFLTRLFGVVLLYSAIHMIWKGVQGLA
jgi:uncharacterized membrane protein YfcA